MDLNFLIYTKTPILIISILLFVLIPPVKIIDEILSFIMQIAPFSLNYDKLYNKKLFYFISVELEDISKNLI